MIKHTEKIRKVGEAELTMGEEFHTITVPVTTAGGVEKLMTFSESEASSLSATLADALAMRPKETRAATFRASR